MASYLLSPRVKEDFYEVLHRRERRKHGHTIVLEADLEEEFNLSSDDENDKKHAIRKTLKSQGGGGASNQKSKVPTWDFDDLYEDIAKDPRYSTKLIGSTVQTSGNRSASTGRLGRTGNRDTIAAMRSSLSAIRDYPPPQFLHGWTQRRAALRRRTAVELLMCEIEDELKLDPMNPPGETLRRKTQLPVEHVDQALGSIYHIAQNHVLRDSLIHSWHPGKDPTSPMCYPYTITTTADAISTSPPISTNLYLHTLSYIQPIISSTSHPESSPASMPYKPPQYEPRYEAYTSPPPASTPPRLYTPPSPAYTPPSAPPLPPATHVHISPTAWCVPFNPATDILPTHEHCNHSTAPADSLFTAAAAPYASWPPGQPPKAAEELSGSSQSPPNFPQNLRHLTQEILSSIQHLMEEVEKERAHTQLGMQAQQLVLQTLPV